MGNSTSRIQLLHLLLFSLVTGGLSAQSIISKEDSEKIFSFAVVESLPQAFGCSEDFSNNEQRACFQQQVLRQVGENFQYPDEDRKAGIQGRVYVSFVVEKDASIGNVEVVRGVSYDLDRECVRVVKKLKIVKPAYQRGKPVRMSYTLPINAKLK